MNFEELIKILGELQLLLDKYIVEIIIGLVLFFISVVIILKILRGRSSSW